LGAGEARMRTADGRPVRATSVFYIDHSNVRAPLPVRIAISGVRIVVPLAAHVSGINVFGHEVTLDHLAVRGAPLTDVVIGYGARGVGGMTARIEVRDCQLSGGRRDVVSVLGPIGLRIEGSTLSGSRGAGIHVRAADRGQPTLDVHVVRNRIVENDGPGIFLDLDPKNGAPVFASGIEIAGNQVLRNARKATASRRAGIVLAGGQSDSNGQLTLTDNVVRANRGPGVLGRSLRLIVSASGIWVSHDDTTITSDGACIVSLGLGAVRLRSNDGDPIASSAVFFVNRSTPSKPAPLRVTISNLNIVVPQGQGMYGVAIFGHETTLSHLDIGGSPQDDVLVSRRPHG